MGNSIETELLAAEVLSRRMPELMALLENEVRTVTVDPFDATSTTLAVVQSLAPYQERLRRLSEFKVPLFDSLEDYALAFTQAHRRYEVASSQESALPELLKAAKAQRRALIAEAKALVGRNMLDAGRLDGLRRKNGFVHLSADLTLLADLLLEQWQRYNGRTPFTREDLELASALALKLMNVATVRGTQEMKLQQALDLRARAFTLLYRAYTEVYHGMAYLRRDEGDVEKLIPSLFGGKKNKRRKIKRTSSVSKEATEQASLLSSSGVHPSGAVGTKPSASQFGPFEN